MSDFPRCEQLPQYVFSIVNGLKVKARHADEDIIDCGMGNPLQPTPQHIIDKLVEASQRPNTHRYSTSGGIRKLREAIRDWYARKFDVDMDYSKQTLVSIGSKEGLFHIALTLTSAGDEVWVPTPTYPIHTYGFIIADAKVQQLPYTTPESLLTSVKASLDSSKTKPKVLMLNFPANPTGECVELEFFAEMVALAKQYGFWIVNDFAYAELAFDGLKPPSILQVPGAMEVAIETYSLSKTYNMPGWRIGFICGNEKIVSEIAHLKTYLDYGMFTPMQVAGITALNGPQQCVDEIRDMYQERRDVLCEGLNKIGWQVEKPKATMFVWAPIPDKFKALDSIAFAEKLLIDTKVAVSPGVGFGEAGDTHVRFSLIENKQRLRQAVRNLKPLFLENA